MSISASIRELAQEGLSVGDIARRLGIRYQHAYKVLNVRKPSSGGSKQTGRAPTQGKPPLTVDAIVAGGFVKSGRWILSSDGLILIDGNVPASAGVYAFADQHAVNYVGVATIGLAKRLYFYGRPGPTQLTNIRIRRLIADECASGRIVDIYTATPENTRWNGLPVDVCSGLEMGLIKAFSLPWNVRSAK